MTQTRIIHLAGSPYDGAGTAALRQHQALIGAGQPSRMLCAHLDPARIPEETTLCPRDREPLLARVRRRLTGRGDAQGKAEREIRMALGRGAGDDAYELFSAPYSRFTPDSHPWYRESAVAHLHWVSGFIDYPRFFRALDRPCVWTLHDQGPYLGGFHYVDDRGSAPSLAALDDAFREVKRGALRSARAPIAVVGNSEWNTRAAEASGIFPGGTRFHTIYYPLDTGAFSPLDRGEAKRRAGVPEGEFTVGFASTSLGNRRKGLADLVEALALLPTEGPGPRISLLSFGRPADEGARAAVRFPWRSFGFVHEDSRKRELYSAMDCFVVPSRAEAFGQTAIEAMACGVPVIGANVGGLTEALDSGRAGLLFRPGDPREIAGLIRRLLSDPAEASAIGAAGRDHVVVRHSPGACASSYLSLYREMISLGETYRK